MNEVLAEEIAAGFFVEYIDDICIFSEEIEDHLEHAKEVVEKLKKHQIKIKMSKSEIAQLEIHFLGHVVSKDSIKPDPKKVSVLVSQKIPETLAQLWSFMGLINYQREFIPKFSEKAELLNKMINTKDLDGRFKKKNIDGKKVYLTLEEDGIKAFHCLREIMMSHRVLIMPDF